MSIDLVISETIRLAEACQAERQSRDEDRISLPVELSYKVSLSPAEAVLLDYLQSQSPQDLHRLRALMYFGRGDDGDLLRLEETLGQDQGFAAWSMFEKSPLAEYLRDGRSQAKKLGIDLDSWWRGELVRPVDVETPRIPYSGPTFSLPAPEFDPIKYGPKISVTWPHNGMETRFHSAMSTGFFSNSKSKLVGLS